MILATIDWLIILLFFVLAIGIGIAVYKRAGKNTEEYFLSGRNMPWWLLGVSMVATTFSSDTPNLVTDIVRQNGVAGNWVWWAFLLTGMLTVFVYAKLWRRSRVMTDLEFYEIRYGGKLASFLRGFRSLYLGLFFNVMIMATVSLAAIKIGSIFLGLSPLTTILIASTITVIYSALGGLRGVIWTDFFQFGIAMAGAVGAAYVAVTLPEVGGLYELFTHEALEGKLRLLPDFSDTATLIPLFIIPIAVQWWSVWYPGSEPGGGGYIAQRMLSSRTEKDAIGATLFFNVVHYAVRPWPWILVALASLIVYPDLASIQQAFPGVKASVIKDDIAYPAMLTFLPTGLLGLVVASLIAAYMSTVSTHLNWGASYIVHDFYRRFVDPDASEKKLVALGRFSTIVLMILAGVISLWLKNALQAFHILLQIGAGTGLIFILRWFWWRINAFTELSGMIVSFIIAVVFEFGFPEVPSHIRLVSGVATTTAIWLMVTLLTRPTDERVLRNFVKLTRPGGPGWRKVMERAKAEGEILDRGQEAAAWELPREILAMVVGCVTVYSALFAVGFWIYANILPAIFTTIVTAGGTLFIFRIWNRLHTK